MIAKCYIGKRNDKGRCEVFVRNGGSQKPLPPRDDLFNHSPDGFEWGYFGSGPAQLALAILADLTGDDNLAVRLHQDFKQDAIAGLRRGQTDEWVITAEQVRQWLLKQAVQG